MFFGTPRLARLFTDVTRGTGPPYPAIFLPSATRGGAPGAGSGAGRSRPGGSDRSGIVGYLLLMSRADDGVWAGAHGESGPKSVDLHVGQGDVGEQSIGAGGNLTDLHQMANVSGLQVEQLGSLGESHLVGKSDASAPLHPGTIGTTMSGHKKNRTDSHPGSSEFTPATRGQQDHHLAGSRAVGPGRFEPGPVRRVTQIRHRA